MPVNIKDISIIAVDFDGTLCQDAYPGIGMPDLKLIYALKELRASGKKLILWTCRNGLRLSEAVEWCSGHGLFFDAVNENLPEILEKYGSDSRKITADIYIDDRSVFPMSLVSADDTSDETGLLSA
ncbi:MAG: hypothetical protein K5886_05725 [Lachnospiraceae bacterium]|nr:hypothetical protein [Lachnospiraceae bacterium]